MAPTISFYVFCHGIGQLHWLFGIVIFRYRLSLRSSPARSLLAVDLAKAFRIIQKLEQLRKGTADVTKCSECGLPRLCTFLLLGAHRQRKYDGLMFGSPSFSAVLPNGIHSIFSSLLPDQLQDACDIFFAQIMPLWIVASGFRSQIQELMQFCHGSCKIRFISVCGHFFCFCFYSSGQDTWLLKGRTNRSHQYDVNNHEQCIKKQFHLPGILNKGFGQALASEGRWPSGLGYRHWNFMFILFLHPCPSTLLWGIQSFCHSYFCVTNCSRWGRGVVVGLGINE